MGIALVAFPWVPQSSPTHGAEQPPIPRQDKPSVLPSIPALDLNGSDPSQGRGLQHRTETPPLPSPPSIQQKPFSISFLCFLFSFSPLSFPPKSPLRLRQRVGAKGREEEEGSESKTEVRCGFFWLFFGLFFGEGGDDDDDTRLDASPDVHQPEIGPSWAALRRSPRAPQRSPALNIAAHTRTFLFLWVPNFIFFFPW